MWHYTLRLLPLIFISLTAQGQDAPIEKLKWTKRVFLLVAPNEQARQINETLAILQSCQEGVDTRKIETFVVTPGVTRNSTVNQVVASKDYNKYAAKASFEIVLIGLDGGVKWRASRLVDCRQLFIIIDVMPIRQEEMRQKGNP